MEKSFKRLLSLAVALVMVLGMVPFNGLQVFAAETAEADLVISTVEDLQNFAASVNAGNSYEGKLVVLANDIEMMDAEGIVTDMTPIGTQANPFKGTFDGQEHTIKDLYITYYKGEHQEEFANSCVGLFGVINTPAIVKNVTVHNPYMIGESYVGAIVGMAYTGRIENCHVTGEIDIEGNYMVGGITGHGYARIANCSVIGAEDWDYSLIAGVYKAGNLEGDNIGGIVGHNAENNSISGCTVKNLTVTGTRKVAGIVGITAQSTNITGCQVSNVTVGTTATEDYAADNAKTMSIGGIVGQYMANGNGVGGSMTDCTVEGLTFTNENKVTVHAGALTGGVRGASADGTLAPDNTSITISGNSAAAVTGGTVTYLEPSYAAMIGTQGYETFAEALSAAKTMTGDVVVEIYDKVTLDTDLSGSFDSIKLVGKDADAEVYLDVLGYITATGKKVAFEGLKLSKSEGGYVGNAGFMNVAFGVYDVSEVTYTDCTFVNGAYAASGVVTYNGCTFYRSWDKYGLWAYGNVDVTVAGCTFADYRGIKMYAEGAAKTVDLTIKNTNFTALTDKPAIVLTYGESVTLENNTYSSTGAFELDLDGAPNGTPVTSDNLTGLFCKNDNGACGVLVDGKIYTTVAQAAEVATSGSTVTLLHDSAETVELADGVILDKNGYTAAGVSVAASAVAKVGDDYYTDLQEAIVAAAPSGTVELLSDVTVDKWIMISQSLSIGSGQIITVDEINGLTIDGNGKTLTIKGIESASNGGMLFYDATKLNIKNLTINYVDAAVNAGGIGLTSGTIENVTINGGVGVFPGTGDITITGCTFNTNGCAIYNEQDRDNLVVTGNTFNTAAGQYAIYLRGDTTFTGNTVTSGKVNVTNSATGTISGNNFGTERIKVYNGATATISNNTIKNLVFNEPTAVANATFTDNTLSEKAQAALDAVTPVYVAKVNGIGYTTFEEALAAACTDANATRIEILADCEQTTVANTSSYNDVTKALTIGAPAGESYTVTINPVGDSIAVRIMDGGSLTIEENVTINHLDVVANGFSTTGENMTIEGTLYALSLKQWTSNGTITVTETGKVILGNGDGQLDLAYGNGTVTINGTGDKTVDQFKAGYSGTRGNGNTLNLNNTSFDAGAWFNVNGSNGIFNVNNSVLKVSGGDFNGDLTVTSTGNKINLTNGSELKAGVLTLGEGNQLKLDATSKVTAKTVTGAGTLVIDATGMKAGDTYENIAADLSGYTGAIQVENNNLNAEIVDGKIVLKAAPVVSVDGVEYADLESALKAIEANSVVEILDDIIIAEYWDCRNTGAKITVPVTINGNEHTIKFTNTVYDAGNHMAAFRFEAAATVNNLTIDMSEALSGWGTRLRAISAKSDLTVDGCTFIGNGSANNTRAIIFGEGAGDAIGDVVINITGSTFTGWRQGVSDNEQGKDEVKSLTITGNTFTDAGVNVSAAETINFSDNTVAGRWVKLTHYNSQNLTVNAKGNTLTADGSDSNVAKGAVLNVQDEFLPAVAEVNGVKYKSLQAAIDAATEGATVTLIENIQLTQTVKVTADKKITLDLNGKTVSMETADDAKYCLIYNKGNLKVTDSGENGKLSYYYTGTNSGDAYNTVESAPGSVLTVQDGTIENLSANCLIAYAIDGLTNGSAGDVIVNIEGGKITGKKIAVRIFANSTTKTGTLNISGGEISGRVIIQNANASANKAVLNITDGTFNTNGYKTDVLYVGGSNGATGDITASVSNGTFNGEILSSINKGFISGGVFDRAVPEAFCAEGYVPADNGDGTYGVKIGLPEVEITNIKNTLTGEDPDLTFALNFAIPNVEDLTEDYLNQLFETYGDHYVDYVLTISGLSQESIVFNANGNADGYLAGQYDAWSENWLSVPFDNVVVNNGQSLYIMEYAAKLMNKPGLRFTLAEVATIVQNFDCGVYFTPEFLAANPDMEVSLELKVFTEDENGEIAEDISVAENQFENNYAAAVSGEDKQTVYYTSFAEAYAAAQAGDTVHMLTDATMNGKLTVNKAITIDGNGKAIIANHSAFILETSADCTFKDITLDTNNKAKGVKIASGNVVFDNVTIPNSNKSDAITVYGSLTIKNYFSVESTYQVFDARNGSVTAESGTVFDFTSRIGLASPANCDFKSVVDTEGNPFFCAYASTSYYTSLTALSYSDLTLLDDATLSSTATVSGTLDLNGKTLTVADGKALKVTGNLTITGEGDLVGEIRLTKDVAKVTAPADMNVTSGVADHTVIYNGGVYMLVKEGTVAWNVQTGTEYETVAAALLAAKENETVQLLADSDESTAVLTVLNGITLDLNGHNLTAYYAMTATVNSYIMDSTNGEGLLKVAKNNLILADNNEQLKIWKDTEAGYCFASATFKTKLESNGSGTATFRFYLNETYGAVMEELADGAADGDGLTLRVKMTYANSQGGKVALYFDYPQEKIQEYAAREFSGTASHLYMIIRGLKNVTDVSFQAVVASGNVVLESEVVPYNG